VKIRSVGAEIFHADGRTDGQTDGRTDMTKLMAAFRDFPKAPKNCYIISVIFIIGLKVKVKQSIYRPGVAQRVPGS